MNHHVLLQRRRSRKNLSTLAAHAGCCCHWHPFLPLFVRLLTWNLNLDRKSWRDLIVPANGMNLLQVTQKRSWWTANSIFRSDLHLPAQGAKVVLSVDNLVFLVDNFAEVVPNFWGVFAGFRDQSHAQVVAVAVETVLGYFLSSQGLSEKLRRVESFGVVERFFVRFIWLWFDKLERKDAKSLKIDAKSGKLMRKIRKLMRKTKNWCKNSKIDAKNSKIDAKNS